MSTTTTIARARPGASMAEPVLLRRRSAWSRFRRHRIAVVALGALVGLLLLAMLAPVVAPYDPDEQNLRLVVNGRPAGPSLAHPFGTDQLGRDYLSRVLFGARISLAVGLGVMAFSISVGTVLGALAGYFGGLPELVIMRVTDVLLCFPPLLFLLAVQATVPNPSVPVVIFIIGLVYWMTVARLVRAEILSLRAREFDEAARALG